MNIIYFCEKCGEKPEPTNKGKNFDTIPAICPKCGGKITMKLERKKK